MAGISAGLNASGVIPITAKRKQVSYHHVASRGGLLAQGIRVSRGVDLDWHEGSGTVEHDYGVLGDEHVVGIAGLAGELATVNLHGLPGV